MIKILLGVYGDEINAQNINGVEISKRLDKKKFEIHMFYYNNRPDIDGVIFHKTGKNKLLKNIRKMYTFMRNDYDIYYLPRLEKTDLLFAKIYSKKRCIISSIEIENAIYVKKYKEFFCKDIFDFFSINNELKNRVLKDWKKDTDILYLGYCETGILPNVKEKINNICFVGSLTERKRPMFFLKIASMFPEIGFKMIGDGPLKREVIKYIKENDIRNVELTGRIANENVYNELNKSDLLVITSDNEGQPKVSLEAGSLGVPTCYIKENYKIDYISNMETGFEVNSIDDMINLIKTISEDSELLKKNSRNVAQVVRKYSWDLLINDYEKYFEKTLKKWEDERNISVGK